MRLRPNLRARGPRVGRVLRLLLVATLPLAMGSCFLRFATLAVFVEGLGEQVDVVVEASLNDVTAGACATDFTGAFGCRYAIAADDGFAESTSSGALISDFGLFGVLIDPLIVQVPLSGRVDHARIDDGSTVLDLVVTETASFQAEPGVTVAAEAGHKFLIFEFPTQIAATLPELDPDLGPRFDFDVRIGWQQATAPVGPIPIKALFAGRVEAGGQVFFPPLFPCVTDMADVPAFNVFQGGPNNVIFDLLFHYFDHEDLVCQDEVFDYSNAGPGPLLCDADGDLDIDRDDIGVILDRRNTPAAPGDPLDRNGDGSINVLDARRCANECTRKDCAVADPAPFCGLGFEACLPLLAWAAVRRRRARPSDPSAS